MRSRSLLALVPILAAIGCSPAAPEAVAPPQPAKSAEPPAADGPPVAEKRPVTNEYHGVKVVDDYQWLEDSKNPDVRVWSDAQTKRARSYLDGLPMVKALREQITTMKTAQSAAYFALHQLPGKTPTYLALRFDPKAQQPVLVLLTSLDDPGSARAVVDPNVMDASGGTTIDFYEASPDGSKVAVSLSKGGTEDGTLHIFDVATGKETGDVIPRVNGGTAGGSAEWSADGKSIYYTRYPAPGERAAEDMGFYQQVYLHVLGKDVKEDTYVIGKDFPRIAEVELHRSEDGKWMVAQVANGDGGEFAFYLQDAKGTWTQFAKNEDKVIHAEVTKDGGIYLLSRSGAPKGQILRIEAKKPDLAKAKVIVPQGEGSIRNFLLTDKRIYVSKLVGGPVEVEVFDAKGKSVGKLPTPPVSSVGQMVHLEKDDILFTAQSFIMPLAWFKYAGGKAEKTKLEMTSPAKFDDAEVVRDTCTSKDGTKVPINIIRKKDAKLDGSHPAYLTAYGGYGISLSPRFNEDNRIWLDKDGVVAVANLRGGGELGEEWHLAGNLAKKQNVFDDFIGCAKYLVDKGYTTPKKLGIVGGSNGGLLMGAALTQAPEMFGAVASFVGIYDMLRVELTPNGSFNVTEFGTVKDKTLFEAMYAYSPYHHVKDGQAYPPVLFVTGENDPRVDPWHSRKMTARLNAASPASRVLLVTKADAGHGVGGSLKDEIQDTVDLYSFLFDALGVK